MRYRRLGRTEFMVSGVGVDLAPLAAADEAIAGATVQAILDAGINLVVVDLPVEPSEAATTPLALVGRVTGPSRPRVLVAARPPEGLAIADLPPIVEDAVARQDGVPLDMLLLPAPPPSDVLGVIEQLRERRLVDTVAVTVRSAGELSRAIEEPLVAAVVLPATLLQGIESAALLSHAAEADIGLLVALDASGDGDDLAASLRYGTAVAPASSPEQVAAYLERAARAGGAPRPA